MGENSARGTRSFYRLGAMVLFWLAVGTCLAGTPPKPIQVVVFGDSLTAGYGIDKTRAFPAHLQTAAAKAGFAIKVHNAGVSGDTSAGGLRRISWSLKAPIDILILELGANDGLRGIALSETATNLQAIIDTVKKRYPKVVVVVAGMSLPPNLGATYIAGFEQLFKNLAQQNKAILIPFLLEGVAGDPKLNQADGIHPTEEGHVRVAQTVWPFLAQALAEHLKEKP